MNESAYNSEFIRSRSNVVQKVVVNHIVDLVESTVPKCLVITITGRWGVIVKYMCLQLYLWSLDHLDHYIIMHHNDSRDLGPVVSKAFSLNGG